MSMDNSYVSKEVKETERLAPVDLDFHNKDIETLPIPERRPLEQWPTERKAFQYKKHAGVLPQ